MALKQKADLFVVFLYLTNARDSLMSSSSQNNLQNGAEGLQADCPWETRGPGKRGMWLTTGAGLPASGPALGRLLVSPGESGGEARAELGGVLGPGSLSLCPCLHPLRFSSFKIIFIVGILEEPGKHKNIKPTMIKPWTLL